MKDATPVTPIIINITGPSIAHSLGGKNSSVI